MLAFSEKLIETIRRAVQICQLAGAAELYPKHLLSALEKTKGCLAFDILAQLKPIAKQEKSSVLKTDSNFIPAMSNETKQSFQRAANIAYQHKHHYIGTEHLLSALLELPVDKIVPANWQKEKIKKHLVTVFKSSSHIPNFSKIFKLNPQNINIPQANNQAPTALDCFTTDLTNEQNQKDLNPVIGREEEIQRLIQILCRKDKNNPVLLGDAGVGKTAIVEGLARKIMEKSAPSILLNKKILNLDLGLIVAGTMYRGEFENRLKMIMDEVESNPNIILFIDELHNIMGAGSAQGTMDAANLLKPMLSRGRLRCIGATTMNEYKKHIETDPALDRRFQPIYLSEPTPEQTLEILRGVKQNYQNFHQVEFTDDALEAAVTLSQRYIQDKLFPDKAIDLIDEAAAKVKIKYQSRDKLFRRRLLLEDQLEKARVEKEQAVLSENFNQAIKIKQTEQGLAAELKKLSEKLIHKANHSKVTKIDILNMVSQKTKIPIAELTEDEYRRLGKISNQLKKIIIGQDEQIQQVIKTISHAKLGLADENRPLASFLLLGPSGSGKTSLVRELAALMFKDSEAFIQLDMSEFNEKFQSSKLIGAPAGYVGYREANKFTDLVRKNPHCILLLDEIEKAHPDVLDLLLQILEHGHLTDSAGKKINFKNAIIFMTSNILADKLSAGTLGFNSSEENTNKLSAHLPELKKQFKPELINRINNIIIFNSLTAKDLEAITRKELNILLKKLQKKNVALKFSSPIVAFLAKQAAAENSGARAVQNIIKQQIENNLMETLMTQKKKTLNLSKHQNKIIVK